MSVGFKVGDPPLDLPSPKGKEAEWALLHLAKMVGVECKYETWDELASEISKRLKREVEGDGHPAQSVV